MRSRCGTQPTASGVLALAFVTLAASWHGMPASADPARGLRTDDPASAAVVASVSIDDAGVAEGDSGTRSLVFTLRLSEPATDTASVEVATFDSTATNADLDYQPASGRVTFPRGSMAEYVSVSILGDTNIEADERFLVRLSAPVRLSLADDEAVGTIVSDDFPVLSVADTATAEGNSGTHTMAFLVRLTPPALAPVTFQYRVLDGTARVADQDYEAVSGEGRFEVGEDQVLIEVPVLGDSLLEGNDRFTLRVESVQGAVPSELSAIGTIRNDERTSFQGFNPPIPPFGNRTLPPAWGDVDGDDRPDLPLYLNDGGNFEEMPGIRSLLGDGNYHGAAWCDYDKDGDMDLVILPYPHSGAESSYNFTHLIQNTPTGLQDVAPALGMDIVGRGETPAWGDFNADGWPDLYLPFYSHIEPFRSYFYLNLGNGQFEECADSAGVAMPNLPIYFRPEGIGVADWNGDGALDIYCASHLFLNDGNARFIDVRAQVGLPLQFDEGCQFVDHDDDGDLDLYLRTSRGPTLYRNDDGTFSDVTASLGLGPVDWLWGDRWADLDSDGDLDLLFFTPGATARLLLNRGDGTFEEDLGFAGVVNISSLSSFADMDGDGDVDIAVGDYGRQFARNLLELVPGGQATYLKVRVEDDDGRLTAHGATVRLRSLDDPSHPVQTRIVDGGSGYLGQDEYTITFGGVGSGTYDLEVSYPARPGAPRVVGPKQNSMLAGLHPMQSGPLKVVVRPGGHVTIHRIGDSPQLAVEQPSPRPVSMLWPPAPNPARHSTRFDFTVPAEGAYTLTIHDVSGREVRTLATGRRAAEGASAAWDLRDNAGRVVPAGLYFARLVRPRQRVSVQRVVVLR